MLDKLRNLFLSALQCDNDYKAQLLVDAWNEEIKQLQKIYDTMTSKASIVRQGRWVNDKGLYRCSECNELWTEWWANVVPIERMNKTMRYCPHCGAKMDAEEVAQE